MPVQSQNNVIHPFLLKNESAKSADYLVRHIAIGQGLNFSHRRHGNDLRLPVDHFELIRKFMVRAGYLRKSKKEWHDSRKTLDCHATVNIDAGYGIVAQNILQHSLAKNNAKDLWKFRHSLFSFSFVPERACCLCSLVLE